MFDPVYPNRPDPDDARAQADAQTDATPVVTEDPYAEVGVLIRDIEAAADMQDRWTIAALLREQHAADIADLLEKVQARHRGLLIEVLRDGFDPEILAYMNETVRDEVLALLSPSELAEAIDELDSDDAVELIDGLDEDIRKATLKLLNPLTRRAVEEGLSFPEGSAGRMMQREAFAMPENWTIGKTIDFMRAQEEDDLPPDFYDLYVVDAMARVVGIIPLSRVLRNKRWVRIGDICDRDVDMIPATMPEEEVGFIFRHYGLVSAPVVDDQQRLLGAVTVDDVVEVIEEQAEEDMYKLSGVSDDNIYGAIKDIVRTRAGWLFLNLLTAILASLVIGLFEATIQQIVALAVLMPIVASMGGNAGTQTLTIAVRAIATKEISEHNAWRVVWREVLVGGANGIIFAVIAGLVAGIWFMDIYLGIAIALAMVATLVVAALSGTLIPLGLQRIGVDPAIASTVFLTTVTDVVGFFTFLGLAGMLLL